MSYCKRCGKPGADDVSHYCAKCASEVGSIAPPMKSDAAPMRSGERSMGRGMQPIGKDAPPMKGSMQPMGNDAPPMKSGIQPMRNGESPIRSDAPLMKEEVQTSEKRQPTLIMQGTADNSNRTGNRRTDSSVGGSQERNTGNVGWKPGNENFAAGAEQPVRANYQRGADFQNGSEPQRGTNPQRRANSFGESGYPNDQNMLYGYPVPPKGGSNNGNKKNGPGDDSSRKKILAVIIGVLAALVLILGIIMAVNIFTGEKTDTKSSRKKEDFEEDDDDNIVLEHKTEAVGTSSEEEDPTETVTPTPTATPTPTPTETPTPTPEPPTTLTLVSQTPSDLGSYSLLSVANATASSTITGNLVNNYPIYMFDGRDDTSWQEGVSGYGLGENFTFSFGTTRTVKCFGFKLGNWKNDEYYYGNARPKTMTITAGSFTGQVTFTGVRDIEWVEFNKEVSVDSITMVINDVYQGTSWQDTCISEIMVYGK